MCLAVPLKLIEIQGNDAVGEAMGMQRKLRVDFIPEPIRKCFWNHVSCSTLETD